MEENKSKNAVLIRLSKTLADYDRYFKDGKSDEVRESLNETKYTVGETDVSYRVMNHWDEQGLIPNKTGVGDWRKFSFVERVWIEAVKGMRDFGISLDVIGQACKQIMQKKKGIVGYPDFEYFVIKAWISDSDPYILVLRDGQVDIGTMEEIELSKSEYGEDMLLISLKQILKNLGLTVRTAMKLLYLNKNEQEVLENMRLTADDEVSVSLNSERKITEIRNTKTANYAPVVRDILLDMEREDIYGQLSVMFEKGKPRSSKIIKKKKLS